MDFRIFLIILLGALFVESVTQLFFEAAPLQPIRNYIRSHTPIFYSKEKDQHLLDCKYCVSVWVAFTTMAVFYLLAPNMILTIIFFSCIVHRVSNYIHITYSIVRDRQLDLRIQRRIK